MRRSDARNVLSTGPACSEDTIRIDWYYESYEQILFLCGSPPALVTKIHRFQVYNLDFPGGASSTVV